MHQSASWGSMFQTITTREDGKKAQIDGEQMGVDPEDDSLTNHVAGISLPLKMPQQCCLLHSTIAPPLPCN